ncbi:hypothetical protein ACIA47_05735 [Micromonospora sp. NPDC051227]|uniref:hypothetical protein n=1 Tax=Micromonospora sp. NPDC051227 TaxID=3364285 RepID=UPI0037B3EDAF
MKTTRIAYSHRLNAGKYAALVEQARLLGRVPSEVWQRYASVGGAALTDRQVRDRWLADGTHGQFGVLANAWKETVRDVLRRHGDPDITLHTPHRVVRQIVQARADRHRSRLPLPDSSPDRRAESESSEALRNER